MPLNHEKTGKDNQKHSLYWHFNRFLERHLPRGLYPRSLIIVVAPMVLLQSFMIYVILEQHWSVVTKRLSRAVVSDIAYIVADYESLADKNAGLEELQRRVNSHLSLGMRIQKNQTLPPPKPKPFFSLVDKKLSRYIVWRVKKPFWIDTISNPNFIDIRIQVDKNLVFQFLVQPDRTYATQSGMFLGMLVGSSLMLIIVAIMFLRKQIKPILNLARAAKSFGMGRDIDDFHPSGAREVQIAAQSFISMKHRITRQVEQRTLMLAGVSHDLRTILTRFKLQLAMFGDSNKTRDLDADVEEMHQMIEAYLSFVRGDGGEVVETTNISAMLRIVQKSQQRAGHTILVNCADNLQCTVKPNAFRRLLDNIVSNSVRMSQNIKISAEISDDYLTIIIEDDGPGIDAKDREAAFRPFVRLDNSRNQDEAGTGLGLAIAQDIVHSHGGNIRLEDNKEMGGLKVVIEIPV